MMCFLRNIFIVFSILALIWPMAPSVHVLAGEAANPDKKTEASIVNRLPVTFDKETGYRVQFEKVRGIPAPIVIGPPADLTQETDDPAIAEEKPLSPSDQEGP